MIRSFLGNLTWRDKWLFIPLSILLPALIIPAVYDTWKIVTAKRSEPIVWISGYAVPDEAAPGDSVWIVYEGIRRRFCKNEYVDFWIAPSGERIATFSGQGGYSPVGEIKPRFRRSLPIGHGKGAFIYRSRLTHYCPDGIHNTQHPPDIVVNVQ